MDRATVALVSDSAGYGGSEAYLVTLVSGLSSRWRFLALVGAEAAEETRVGLAAAGAEVLTIHGLKRIPSPGSIRRLVGTLRDIKPALVHVNLTDQGDGLGPLVGARLSRLRTMATLHLVIPDRAAWRERVSRRTLGLPQLVVGVSESVAQYARHAGARTTVVLNGSAEPELESEPRERLGLAPTAFVIGGIGRIHDQKGWDVLCRAAPLVRHELPDVEFVVVGDGPKLDLLKSEYGGDVRFVGFRENASSLVRAFDILVVPSRYEAFGFVALEAMYAGVPVVASAVGGLPEVIGDCGVLLPPERPDLLSAAIIELARDREARATSTRRGAERARSLFTAERMAAETSEVYETVARGGSSDSRRAFANVVAPR